MEKLTNGDPFARRICDTFLDSSFHGLLDDVNIVITGHKNHGKDVVSEIVAHITDCEYISSSRIAMERFIFDEFKDKYGYATVEECYQDRDNHREELFQSIVAFNTPDLHNLCSVIFEESNIYCGLRNVDELKAAREANLIDLVVWVDASEYKPLESKKSLTVTREDCDWVIDNNRHGDAEHLKGEIIRMLEAIRAMTI